MRQAIIKYKGSIAGLLTERDQGDYVFEYDENFIVDHPTWFITFDMPVRQYPYYSTRLFPFFDGLIPEGWLLNIASNSWKINKADRMGLLLACCRNCIGAVSVYPVNPKENE